MIWLEACPHQTPLIIRKTIALASLSKKNPEKHRKFTQLDYTVWALSSAKRPSNIVKTSLFIAFTELGNVVMPTTLKQVVTSRLSVRYLFFLFFLLPAIAGALDSNHFTNTHFSSTHQRSAFCDAFSSLCSDDTDSKPSVPRTCLDNEYPITDDYYFEFDNMHLIRGMFMGQNYDLVSDIPTLYGCRNDAWNFYEWATISKGIPAESLQVITDVNDPLTKRIVLASIQKLAKHTHSAPGPHRIILTFSGHGTNRKDGSGDERDNQDEAMVIGREVIADDELHEAMGQFHKNSRILAFVDTCFSGTMFDLPYRYQFNADKPDSIEEITSAQVKNIPAYMIAISASRDSESSADAYFPSPSGKPGWSSQGDFTNRVIKAMNQISYQKLLAKEIPIFLKDQKYSGDARYNLKQHAVVSSNFQLGKNLRLFGW